mmetsp:Transcript_10122/g.26259  ORF Transcript_10122/g.26259 Transcript_10122/m.26259 type:complete len:203 (-) Transcript_10122:102-710(-)
MCVAKRTGTVGTAFTKSVSSPVARSSALCFGGYDAKKALRGRPGTPKSPPSSPAVHEVRIAAATSSGGRLWNLATCPDAPATEATARSAAGAGTGRSPSSSPSTDEADDSDSPTCTCDARMRPAMIAPRYMQYSRKMMPIQSLAMRGLMCTSSCTPSTFPTTMAGTMRLASHGSTSLKVMIASRLLVTSSGGTPIATVSATV